MMAIRVGYIIKGKVLRWNLNHSLLNLDMERAVKHTDDVSLFSRYPSFKNGISN